MKNIRSANESDGEQIMELLDSTFGPGRYARSVYRLREMRPFVEKFSYVYEQNNKILASISYCKTIINLQSTGLLLGPLAVELEQKGKGFGVQLVEHTLSLINDDSKFDFVIVVGDLDYYERFGFNRIEQDIKFYGPVDKNKLLLKTIKNDLLFKEAKSLDFS
jgi:predicted N-acetyltransferase YhbS